MADQDTDDAAQEQDPAQEMENSEVDVGRPGSTGYAPSDVEVTRGRMQGLGVGAQDLSAQRDPTTFNSAGRVADESGPRESSPQAGARDTKPQTAGDQ